MWKIYNVTSKWKKYNICTFIEMCTKFLKVFGNPELLLLFNVHYERVQSLSNNRWVGKR